VAGTGGVSSAGSGREDDRLEAVFRPVKMNFEILGNAVPHLHCHIKPRYYGDPAPGKPIHPDERVVRLSPTEYEQRVGQIRTAL
jgi:diadenosine tetraphosphate (Ap4A) HIT family hydrolase